MKKKNGIWFFGLSGSGKTFASEYINKKIKKSIIIDGDIVRKYVSQDLGFDKKSREHQIKRIFGISQIILTNNYFPIISTVYMNKSIAKLLAKSSIDLIHIKRDLSIIKKSHPTYVKNKKDIVGIDIKYESFKYKTIINNEEYFCKNLIKLTK